MKNQRRFWWSALLLCLSFSLGCKRQAEPDLSTGSWKVVMLSARGERVYENGQRTALARLMAQDSRFQLQVLDAGFSVETQAEQLEAAIAEKPMAIVLDPLEGKALRPGVMAAQAADIWVIGLGQEAEELECTAMLIADQRRLGEMAGEVTVRALLKKSQESGGTEAAGRVVEIRGDDESRQCQLRHEGFESALAAAPGVILVHDAPGDWSLTGGRDRTLDALRLQHSFDVVYAHNDIMAFGSSLALAQANKRADVMVIGTDGFRGREGGMTLVGDGEIDATLYQPLLVDFAWLLLRKKTEEPSFQPKTVYEMPLRSILPRDLDDIRLKGLPPYPEL